ncbi:hypothetical protein Tco_1041241 [Tanacetum coccineum]|uniref:Integrase, catalytic region, zinc finger, CCHC-type, peptidase aspartic, catalytic n=1 Tax=Tanacetum coccineum TaxID=301880 RepID=A0ABQ5GH19_9ASTR
MNIYNMKLEQYQVNTKFLNTLPPEWSKFVTDVKLVRDFHTTNVDQLHAYLGQHEFHANEVRLMHERNLDPLALSTQYGSPYQSQQYSNIQSSTPISITCPSNDYQSSVHHNVYSPSSSIPQLEYVPSVNQQPEFSQPDSGLIVLVFQKGDDPIDAINHMMSFLTVVEKVLEITALKDDLRKLKGKALVDNEVTKHPSDLEMLQINMEPIIPKLLNKRTTHFAYIKHTQEEAAVLRDLVDHVKANYPLDNSFESACTVKPSTSASGSQPSGNTKKDKIRQTPSSTQKNKVESHPRKVKSSLKNKDYVVAPKGTAHVQHSKLNANYEHKCVKCNGCMLSDNHDLCVLDFINIMNARVKSKSMRKVWKPTGKVFTNIGYIWRPTGRTFTIVGNVCLLTRITITTEVPFRKPTALNNETSKPVVTLVYSRKPRKSKTNVPVGKYKVHISVYANKKEPSQSWGSIVSDVPSSSLDECRSSKLFYGIWTPAAPSI